MPRHTLLHGPAGTAALEFAACFPDPLVADTDGHAALLGLRHEPVTGPDELHALVERIADGKTTCGTLVVENVSSIFDRLSWAIDEPDNRYWRERSRRWYELVARMRELPCNVVLVAREKTLYAQAGEMVNGRTVGVDESVAIGTTADLERTTEYHFEVTVRLTVDAFTKLRIAHVTTSYLPHIVAGAVGLADTAFVQTLLGPLAVTEPTPAPALAPGQAAAPAPEGDAERAATTSTQTALAPATAEPGPAPGNPAAVEPAQPDGSNTASASSSPIEEAAPPVRDEMLIDEDEIPEPATPPTAAAAEEPSPVAAPTAQVIPFPANGGAGAARRDGARDRAGATPSLGTGPDADVTNKDLNDLFRRLVDTKRTAGTLEEGFPRSVSAWIRSKALPAEPNPGQRRIIATVLSGEINAHRQPAPRQARTGTEPAKYGRPAHLQ
jgi:AAA domain